MQLDHAVVLNYGLEKAVKRVPGGSRGSEQSLESENLEDSASRLHEKTNLSGLSTSTQQLQNTALSALTWMRRICKILTNEKTVN